MNTVKRLACAPAAGRLGVMAAVVAAAIGMSGAARAADLPVISGYTTRVYAKLPAFPEITPWGLVFDAQHSAILTGGCEAVCDVCAPQLTRVRACEPWVVETLPIDYFASDCYDHLVVMDRTGSVTGTPWSMIVSSYYEDVFGDGFWGQISVYTPTGGGGALWYGRDARIRGMAIDGQGDLVFSVDEEGDAGAIMRLRGGTAEVVTEVASPGPLAISEVSHNILVGCEDGRVRVYSPSGQFRFVSLQRMQAFPGFVVAPATTGGSGLTPGIYAVDEQEGQLIMPSDSSFPFTVVAGSGFTSHYGTAVFGPGGALYMVDSENKRVLQFMPEEMTGPVIITQPAGRRACLNETVGFSVGASSAVTPSPTVRWFFKGTPDVEVGSGAALLVKAKLGTFGKYYAVITDCQGGMTVSQEVELKFAGCVLVDDRPAAISGVRVAEPW